MNMQLIITVLCNILIPYIVCQKSVTVKVSQGWLKGQWLQTVTGDTTYCSFKGIPYARPPVGKLRFKAPRPPLSWDGVRNATDHGSICPQVDFYSNQFIPGNEDCLFLNVYSRKLKPETPMPVIFFIHGGAFRSGSGNVDNYGPDFLVGRNVVVVTFNYRVDALGFLCMNTKEVPGNAGLKDQVAALKWVNKNVKNFGGDPTRITIMGQSAGGASVGLHLISPLSKGLFQRAIAMSGSPFCEWALPFKAELRPFILGKQLGLDTKDPNELLDFLQSLPAAQLVNTYPSITSSEELAKNNVLKRFSFSPVVEIKGEDNFLPDGISNSLRRGNVNEADVLFGYTNEETLLLINSIVDFYLKTYDRYPELLVPKKILNTSPVDIMLKVSKSIRNHYFGHDPIDLKVIREFVTFLNYDAIIYDVLKYIDMLPRIGSSRKYVYKLSVHSDRNYYGKAGEKYGIYGVAHTDDILYLFDAKRLNMTLYRWSREYDLVQFVTTIFTNFVKFGTPTPGSSMFVNWPEYNNVTKRYVDISNTLRVRSEVGDPSIEFWDNLYTNYGPQIYNSYK